MKKVDTPTLDKMLEIKEDSQICGEFLEWLQTKFVMFDKSIKREEAFYMGGGDYINAEHILADFFGIDLQEAEKEKELLLQSITQ